jgi:hypothetical protein
VPGDLGAHGRFDALAHDHSSQAWLTTHRSAALGFAAAGAMLAAALLGRRR